MGGRVVSVVLREPGAHHLRQTRERTSKHLGIPRSTGDISDQSRRGAHCPKWAGCGNGSSQPPGQHGGLKPQKKGEGRERVFSSRADRSDRSQNARRSPHTIVSRAQVAQSPCPSRQKIWLPYAVRLPSSFTPSDVPMFRLQPTSIPATTETLRICVIIVADVISLVSLGLAIYAVLLSLEPTVAESPLKSWQERTYDSLDDISKKTIPVLEKLAGKVERHRAKQPEHRAKQPEHRAGEPSKQHGTDAQRGGSPEKPDTEPGQPDVDAQFKVVPRVADPADIRPS